MWVGVLFALVAGLFWGLVFVVPVILPEYPPVLLAAGRYVAFGLVTLPMAWMDRRHLRQLTRADWLEAFRLVMVGNLIYYCLLATSIQLTGAPLPTMIIGTLPVVIAVCANLRQGPQAEHIRWRLLLPSLALIAAGIVCVNQAEWAALQAHDGSQAGGWRRLAGVVLACAGVVCWTWYPLRNADWLRAHPDRHPRSWASAQGLMTLVPALLAYAGYGLWNLASDSSVPLPLGERPGLFVALSVTAGVLASWVGALCWNEASQRVPTHLLGQLIVFETLAALVYALIQRESWPTLSMTVGAVLLIAGVLWGVRAAQPRKPMEAACP